MLEECKTQVGIVGTIAGPGEVSGCIFGGMAEHSGATPMDMRSDALCAAAEIILEMEKIGNVGIRVPVGGDGWRCAESSGMS